MSSKVLDEIIEPVIDWYELFLSEAGKAIESNMPFLMELIGDGVLNVKGKHMRPILTMLLAKAYGRKDVENIISSSVSVELVHVASLVHDDILDAAKLRHGVPTANEVIGPHAAVLAGDYLLSKGVYYAIKNKNDRAVDLLIHTMEQLVEGELLQKYYSENFNIDREGYFKVVSLKTSCLISVATQLGAMPVNKETMKNLGNCVGTAFQIKDDMLDIWGDHTGKTNYNDFRERKITIPLILAIEDDNSLRQKVINLMSMDDEEQMVIQLLNIVKSKSTYERLNEILYNFELRAKEILDTLPESDARQSLYKFVDFVVQRDV